MNNFIYAQLTFTIREIAIDLLRRHKQIEHLPYGIFKVHLTKLDETAQETRTFLCGIVARQRRRSGTAQGPR